MDEKLQNIISTSVRLFIKYGIRSISMDDICRELAMSKKTLYQYVDNKGDLIKLILQDRLNQNIDFCEKVEKTGLNAIDVLLEVSKTISKNFHDFNPSMRFDLQKYHPEIYKEFTEKHRVRFYDDIYNNLTQGMREGIYRDNLKPEIIARLYVKKLEDLHDPDFIPESEFTFANFFEVMFESHIRGIANEKGIKYFEKQKKLFNFNIDHK